MSSTVEMIDFEAILFTILERPMEWREQFNLAVWCKDNNKIKQSIHWFRIVAKTGFVPAQYVLANQLKKNTNATNDTNVDNGIDESIYWITQAAEQGFALAQYDLGIYLLRIKKRKEAMFWFHRAATQGFAPAQKQITNYMLSKIRRMFTNINRSKIHLDGIE